MINERLDVAFYDSFFEERLPDRRESPDAWYEYSHGMIDFALARYADDDYVSEDPADYLIIIKVRWDQREKFRSGITVIHNGVSIWHDDDDRYDYISTFMIKNMDDLRTAVASIIFLVREAIERERVKNQEE